MSKKYTGKWSKVPTNTIIRDFEYFRWLDCETGARWYGVSDRLTSALNFLCYSKRHRLITEQDADWLLFQICN